MRFRATALLAGLALVVAACGGGTSYSSLGRVTFPEDVEEGGATVQLPALGRGDRALLVGGPWLPEVEEDSNRRGRYRGVVLGIGFRFSRTKERPYSYEIEVRDGFVLARHAGTVAVTLFIDGSPCDVPTSTLTLQRTVQVDAPTAGAYRLPPIAPIRYYCPSGSGRSPRFDRSLWAYSNDTSDNRIEVSAADDGEGTLTELPGNGAGFSSPV
jgi:hypothetical protein